MYILFWICNRYYGFLQSKISPDKLSNISFKQAMGFTFLNEKDHFPNHHYFHSSYNPKNVNIRNHTFNLSSDINQFYIH